MVSGPSPSETRKSRREQQAATREQVITAARRLFLTHGYHATTLSAVVTAAGFTKGAVYSNFSSKAELGFAVVEGIERENILRLAEVFQRTPVAADRARALTAWSEELLRDTASIRLRLELNFAAMDDPDLAITMQTKSRNIRGAMRQMLSEMDTVDGFLLELDVLAPTLQALSTGMGMQRLIDPEFDLQSFVVASGVLCGYDGGRAGQTTGQAVLQTPAEEQR